MEDEHVVELLASDGSVLRRYALDAGETTFGREPNSARHHMVNTHAVRALISRKHCAFVRAAHPDDAARDIVHVRNMGMNGTSVNDRLISQGTGIALRDRDRIALGAKHTGDKACVVWLRYRGPSALGTVRQNANAADVGPRADVPTGPARAPVRISSPPTAAIGAAPLEDWQAEAATTHGPAAVGLPGALPPASAAAVPSPAELQSVALLARTGATPRVPKRALDADGPSTDRSDGDGDGDRRDQRGDRSCGADSDGSSRSASDDGGDSGGEGAHAAWPYPGWELKARKRRQLAHAPLARSGAARGAPSARERKGNLVETFGGPPFSVLDAKPKWWRERHAYWTRPLAEGGYGIDGSDGRAAGLTFAGSVEMKGHNNTSVFDPVLCEQLYRWFAPVGGQVLDPFAGGATRGCVAARLGLSYCGIELRAEQVEANRAQARAIGEACKAERVPWLRPVWIHGDARDVSRFAHVPTTVDFVFSCPPYYDLEEYGGGDADLSSRARTYDEFLAALEQIVRDCLRRLKVQRFAAFVVGEIRDKLGFCRNFVGDTIRLFERHDGVRLYNHAILAPALGTAAQRASTVFENGKLVPTHQHVLVFYKPEPRPGDKPCLKDMGINPRRPVEWT